MKFLKLAATTIVVAGAVDGKENCMDKEVYPTLKLRRQCRNRNQSTRTNYSKTPSSWIDRPHIIPGYGMMSTNRPNPLMFADQQNTQQNPSNSGSSNQSPPLSAPLGRPVLTQNGLQGGGVHETIATSNSNTNNLWSMFTQGKVVPVLKTAGSGSSDSSDPCMAPMSETGYCRALFWGKWTYNAAANACESFTYGGCGATANFFDNRADCEQCVKPEDIVTKSAWGRGSGSSKFNRGGSNFWGFMNEEPENDRSLPKCDQAMVTMGFGRALLPFVSFNKETGACQETAWGGMGKLSTDNAFSSIDECVSECVNNW